jgi:hypothetical protein
MTNATDSTSNSASNAVANAVRSLMGNRRRLLILGAIVLGLGLFFKWNWLVAAGVTPLLISALPCVAMCALGLCMTKMGSGAPAAQPGSTDTVADTAPGANAPLRLVAPSGDTSDEAVAGVSNAKPVSVASKSCCH